MTGKLLVSVFYDMKAMSKMFKYVLNRLYKLVKSDPILEEKFAFTMSNRCRVYSWARGSWIWGRAHIMSCGGALGTHCACVVVGRRREALVTNATTGLSRCYCRHRRRRHRHRHRHRPHRCSRRRC